MSDTTRMRVTVHAVVEYDARHEDYGTADPQEITKMDQASAEEDVFMFLDGEDTEWTIKAEVVA